jgi:hypothetical protein
VSDPYDPFEEWLTQQKIEPLAPPPGAFERIHRSAHRIRRVRAIGTGLAVLLLAVATVTTLRGLGTADSPQVIGQTDGTSDPGPSPGGQSPDPSGTGRSPDSAPSSPHATAPESLGSSPGSSSLPPVPSCQAGQLRVAATPGGGAAGRLGLILSFTNTGSAACVMFGYPGVSFVTGEAGAQIGQAAVRATSVSPVRVELAAGQVARATLIWPNPDPYPEETCRAVSAAGLRIYPPDETASVFVAVERRVCSGDQVSPSEIYPVESGQSR